MYCSADFGRRKAAGGVHVVGNQIIRSDIFWNPLKPEEEGQDEEVVISDALIHRIVFLKECMSIDNSVHDGFRVCSWGWEIWSIDGYISPCHGWSRRRCRLGSRSINREFVQVHMERDNILIDPHRRVMGEEAGSARIAAGGVKLQVQALLEPHDVSKMMV